MSKGPQYAARVARLPEVFELLSAHPAGVPLARLAEEVGAPADELREDLLAFYSADLMEGDPLLGLFRPPVLEFLGDDGAEADPHQAEVVRVVDEHPADELGVQYVDASELALVYTAASALHDIEPDEDLAAAIDVLTETMVGREAGPEPTAARWNRALRPLQTAQRQRNAVRVVYSRAWDHAVTPPRVIHPYRLVQTRRGWEVDAGPPDPDGSLRTYLLSGVREFEVLEEQFVLPDDLPQRLAEQRATSTVTVVLPHHARWAADMYAENVTVVRADEDDVELELECLEPLERRVGMLLLAAGPDSFVREPADLRHAGVVLAEELLVHHRVTG
ncbi:WYL domain-containing protein [Nocardioides panacisoli]|uniref:WYL domain-containing protein n=1 Tax=Nocardioides panacisoli TaxID=627624 RepID=UPI001C628564|nr:WYL domain-containing protein [Nocardioides panacisoli]QYJ04299.1 WYL domain-containing protein [Nocardioides panacisoli]